MGTLNLFRSGRVDPMEDIAKQALVDFIFQAKPTLANSALQQFLPRNNDMSLDPKHRWAHIGCFPSHLILRLLNHVTTR